MPSRTAVTVRLRLRVRAISLTGPALTLDDAVHLSGWPVRQLINFRFTGVGSHAVSEKKPSC